MVSYKEAPIQTQQKENPMQKHIYEQGKLEFINLIPGLHEPVTQILYIAALIGLGVVF